MDLEFPMETESLPMEVGGVGRNAYSLWLGCILTTISMTG